MGSKFSRRVRAWRARKLRRVLLVGLDNSGKTTVVRQFSGADVQGTIPTTESKYEQVNYHGLAIMLMVRIVDTRQRLREVCVCVRGGGRDLFGWL